MGYLVCVPNRGEARGAGEPPLLDLIELVEQGRAQLAESRVVAADLCVSAQSCVDRVRVTRERERHLRSLAMAVALERSSSGRRVRDERA